MDERLPNSPGPIAPELRAAWRFSIIQQAAIYFTVFVMSTDRLRIYAAVIAHILYWAGIAFIIFLRRSKPILIDLLFAKWSYPLLWLATLVVLVQISNARAS